jgi:signal transduction histidine kinase/ActR/RegA family two-component response regulator
MLQGRDRFSLFNQIPLGICVLNTEYQVVFWNRCLEEWTTLSCDCIEGHSITEFFPHFNQSLYINRLTPIFAGGPPTVFSSQLHKHIIPAVFSDGKKRVQYTTVTAIPADEADCFYAMFSIQDVTDLTFQVQEYRQMRDQAIAETKERQLAQEQAEAANRVKDEFLAIVSHELRTPLNPILGWSKLLCEGKLSGEAAQQALNTISRNATLQAELINDLLDVSRILRGELTLNWQIIDLATLVYAGLDTVRLMAENKSISLHFYHDSYVPLRGDNTRLQQSIWNLLTNAIKFTPSGGEVNISLRYEHQHAILSVQDTGQGIASSFLPHVFDPFRQADASTTRRIGGLGLGLAITRHLVELHGGTIEVQSAGENCGSTFLIRLPTGESYRPALAQSQDADPDELPSLSNLRILVVDDEPDSRDLVQFVLEGYGAIVKTAASVTEAIATLETESLDLLVSDLGMPGQDGFDLIRTVRSQGGRLERLPAIALTAYASQFLEQQAEESGYQEYLTKPINPYELIKLAHQLVQQEVGI